MIVTERALKSWLQRPCAALCFLRLIACKNDHLLITTEVAMACVRRNAAAQADAPVELCCANCAGVSGHQAWSARYICLTANWPPLCWHSTSKHSLRRMHYEAFWPAMLLFYLTSCLHDCAVCWCWCCDYACCQPSRAQPACKHFNSKRRTQSKVLY